VDDEPYGGGAGMVIQAPPVLRAVRELAGPVRNSRLILLSPRGEAFDQQIARELSRENGLLFLCGRYEGFDERVKEILQPREISIGDYVLGGGEVAAMVVIEAVSRLIPGVVGDPASVEEDSFYSGLLDHPSYTRPPIVEGIGIPEVLLSGHHEKIRLWRVRRAIEETLERRPDLVRKNWKEYSSEVRRLIRETWPELAEELAKDERS